MAFGGRVCEGSECGLHCCTQMPLKHTLNQALPSPSKLERRSPEENLRARAPVRDGVPRSGEGEANLMCSSCALRAARAALRRLRTRIWWWGQGRSLGGCSGALQWAPGWE